MSPMLIPRLHSGKIPKAAFDKANEIGALLYGEMYSLEASSLKSDHFVIRIRRLDS